MIVFWVLLALFFIFSAFAVGVLYGIDDEPNFRIWLKEQFKLWKEARADFKLERAFLKANPLCVRCSYEKRYRKATHMWTRQSVPEALCDECYHKAEDDYFLCQSP